MDVRDRPIKSNQFEHTASKTTQICRLCLASLDTMVDLFSEEAIHMEIVEKLNEFCHLAVNESDTAPKTICFTCLNEINRFCDFYRRVKCNQKLLALSSNKVIRYDQLRENQQPLEIDNIKSTNVNEGVTEDGDNGEGTIILAIGNEEVIDAEEENIEVLIAEDECEAVDNDDVFEENAQDEFNNAFPESSGLQGISTSHDNSLLRTYGDDKNSNVAWDSELAQSSKPSEVIQESTSIAGKQPSKRKLKHRFALDKPIREFFNLYCDKCQMNFHTFQSMKNHMAAIHNEQFYLVCCNRKLGRRDVIMEHIDSHLDPRKFTCEICNQICKSKITLKMHLKQHVPKEQQPFACVKCGFRFALKSQLKSHMNSHLTQDEKKFVCDQCGKAFAFKFVLEKHKKRMHIRLKNYMCEICARSFVDKVNLTAHKRVHDTSLPRLECHKCNALLKTKKTLKIHMRVHDPSQFSCEICSKVFPTKNGLLNHIRYYHTGKKFPCQTCGKIFKKSLNLKEHMATHTGDILYNCEYCDKKFNAKANRYAHIKKMHPVEWADKRKIRWRLDKEK